jgi:hypothetical protein
MNSPLAVFRLNSAVWEGREKEYYHFAQTMRLNEYICMELKGMEARAVIESAPSSCGSLDRIEPYPPV